jgi:hypothetical protein
MLRLHELSRILADPELHALIRGTPALRSLFSRDAPPSAPEAPPLAESSAVPRQA